jgi:HPr kinase/phosphorylase
VKYLIGSVMFKFDQTNHATAVSINQSAVLIIGKSGSGKSGLALQLLALGGGLIADDQCLIYEKSNQVWVGKPPSLPGLIEVWGYGLLRIKLVKSSPVTLIVNLDDTAKLRFPDPIYFKIRQHKIPVLNKIESSYFPAAIVNILLNPG